jgi:secreted Zn-dependent insulinase-like peptidase
VYEPCYDTLRTKEQLGYTVHSGMRLTHGVLGFCVLVVSGAVLESGICGCGEAALDMQLPCSFLHSQKTQLMWCVQEFTALRIWTLGSTHS